MMIYRRFHISTAAAPDVIQAEGRFFPKVNRLGLAREILREMWHYGLLSRTSRAAVFSRPCIYGVFETRFSFWQLLTDLFRVFLRLCRHASGGEGLKFLNSDGAWEGLKGRYGGFTPQRQKCTGCMRCAQEYPELCRVELNSAYYEGDSYWTQHCEGITTPYGTVQFEARTGNLQVKGMGYKGPFTGPGWDAMWTDMSEIVRPTRDGVYGREFISTAVDIGRKPMHLAFDEHGKPLQKAKTLEIPFPVLFDCLPFNLVTPGVVHAIAMAAERIGTGFIFNMRGLNSWKPGKMIPLVEDENLEKSLEYIAGAGMAEYLFKDHEQSSALSGKIRAFSPEVILSVRLQVTRDVVEEAVSLAKNGIDVIHLCANYHGKSFSEGDNRFISDVIRSVHEKLLGESIRDEVTLIASGGIILAEHVPKAIICGADAVAIDTSVCVALQGRFSGECVLPERAALQYPPFETEWAAQRLVNLLGAWHYQLIEILSAMGIREVRRLRGNIGRAMFNDDLEKEAFGDMEWVTGKEEQAAVIE